MFLFCVRCCRGDCIVAVNGRKVRRIKDVMDVLYQNGLQLDSSIEFTLLREYEVDLVTARVTTAAKPTLELHAFTIPTKMK